MIIDELTIHLRMSAKIFCGRIFQAAEFFQINEQSKPVLPAAYVMPPAIAAVGPVPQATEAANFFQTENYPIIVALSSVPDQQSQGAMVQLPEIESILNSLLFNWRANKEYGGMIPFGSDFMHGDQARYFHRFNFAAAKYLDPDCDGISAELQNDWMALGGLKQHDITKIMACLSLPEVFTGSTMDLLAKARKCIPDPDNPGKFIWEPDPCDDIAGKPA